MPQTVVGLFPTPTDAQRVKQQLVSQGYAANSIRVLSNQDDGFAEGAVSQVSTGASTEPGFMGSMKHFFSSLTGSDSAEQEQYTRGVSAGGALLAVTVPDERAEAVASLLEQAGARDISEESGTTATQPRVAAGVAGATSTAAAGAGAQAIPVVQEELQVGKRQFQRGGVRVYSHLVETPVEENIRLREEHIHVQRTPVNRPATEADFTNFKDKSIELTESAEEAVVAKQARVVEEVTVEKDVTERVQKVADTLRHTEVQVEELPGETTTRKGTSAGKA